MKVLCVDLETGFGGSSRSLFLSIKYLPRNEIEVHVLRGQKGHYDGLYREISVPLHHMEFLPKSKPVKNWPANFYIFGKGYLDRWKRKGVINEFMSLGKKFDLVHFNLDSTYNLAALLARRYNVPVTMHMRSASFQNFFYRMQARIISKNLINLVFITENEQTHFKALGGTLEGRVIYNIVELPRYELVAYPDIPKDDRFRVACLSNFAYARGIDRLVDLSKQLRKMGRRDVCFVVAGNMKLQGNLPGQLGAMARKGASLCDYVNIKGLSQWFTFLGHVPEPERVLAGCHAVIKPTRYENPWSRDILEGMSFGLPVISIGTYDHFLEHGVTGILREHYDVETMAEDIAALADDPNQSRRLGKAGKERVMNLCNGTKRAEDLLRFWRSSL